MVIDGAKYPSSVENSPIEAQRGQGSNQGQVMSTKNYNSQPYLSLLSRLCFSRSLQIKPECGQNAQSWPKRTLCKGQEKEEMVSLVGIDNNSNSINIEIEIDSSIK